MTPAPLDRLGAWLKAWRDLADSPPPEDSVFLQRVAFVERGVTLPAKLVLMVVLLYLLFVSNWFRNLTPLQEDAWNVLRTFYLIYFCSNVGAAIVVWGMEELSVRLVERVVYSVALLDSIFLAALTLVTGGFGSILYWLFPGLILRNAAVVPRADVQIMVNVSVAVFYAVAGILHPMLDRAEAEIIESTGRGAVLSSGDEPGREPIESLMVKARQ